MGAHSDRSSGSLSRHREHPLTASSGVVCACASSYILFISHIILLQVMASNECIDHFLDLIGWSVPLEYIADAGFSVAGVIWLCAALHIRLSWGIVLRLYEPKTLVNYQLFHSKYHTSKSKIQHFL
jgi:hypothetical protein